MNNAFRMTQIGLRFTTLVVIFIILSASSISFKNSSQLDLGIEHKKSKSGNNYTIFQKNNLILEVSLTRPKQNDTTNILSIVGAYTKLNPIRVDGLFIEKGKIVNRNIINPDLDDAIIITSNSCEIFSTNKGKKLTDSLINFVAEKKNSLFQQTKLVENSTAVNYHDKKLFQRRAIVEFKPNKIAEVESNENITLSVFASDLVELGVIDAINTDMGGWDEGWYRNPANKAIVSIGKMKSQTQKQSNWVVFKTNK